MDGPRGACPGTELTELVRRFWEARRAPKPQKPLKLKARTGQELELPPRPCRGGGWVAGDFPAETVLLDMRLEPKWRMCHDVLLSLIKGRRGSVGECMCPARSAG